MHLYAAGSQHRCRNFHKALTPVPHVPSDGDAAVHGLLSPLFDDAGQSPRGAGDDLFVHAIGPRADLPSKARRSEGQFLVKTVFHFLIGHVQKLFPVVVTEGLEFFPLIKSIVNHHFNLLS